MRCIGKTSYLDSTQKVSALDNQANCSRTRLESFYILPPPYIWLVPDKSSKAPSGVTTLQFSVVHDISFGKHRVEPRLRNKFANDIPAFAWGCLSKRRKAPPYDRQRFFHFEIISIVTGTNNIQRLYKNKKRNNGVSKGIYIYKAVRPVSAQKL
jgi:hypothetical protein